MESKKPFRFFCYLLLVGAVCSSGSSYHAIVNAVCAVGRAKPGIATEVVGRALDGGCNATSRESRNKLPYGIGGCWRRRSRSRGCLTRGFAGVVSTIVSVGWRG